MRRLPFHILFACIFLPPVLYILSLQSLEIVARKQWTAELQRSLISNSKALLQGRIRIDYEIKQNVEAFLSSCRALKWGFHAQVTVETETGTWIYPASNSNPINIFDSETYPQDSPASAPVEMLQVAENNLKIMDEGIVLRLTVQIPRNSGLANGILIFFIIVFTILLYRSYRKSAGEARQFEKINQQALNTANKSFSEAQERLRDVTNRETKYQHEIKILKKDLDLADNKMRETEDEALAEMEQLEKNLHESVAFKEELELEILRLAEELEKIEASKKIPPKKQRKQVDKIAKRFNTLYKNLEFQQRAIEGFLHLQGDLQLRSEELIHTMNEDSSKLLVKRKVFSKKGATPSFECEFGYRGRIYWRPGTGSKTQILTIGTKNTQAKDLAYIETLP